LNILNVLSSLEGKATPPTFDVAKELPAGAVVVGKVPENLRILIFEAVRVSKLVKEMKHDAEYVSIDEIMNIHEELTEPDADREEISQREDAKEQKIESEIGQLTTLSEALSAIFWHEVKVAFADGVQHSDLTISKDWDIIVLEEEEEEDSETEHSAIIIGGIMIPIRKI